MIPKKSRKIEFESSNVDFKIYVIVLIALLFIIYRAIIVSEFIFLSVFILILFFHLGKVIFFKKTTFLELEIIITHPLTKKLINSIEWSEIKRIEVFYFSDRVSREKDINLILKSGKSIKLTIHSILMEDLYNNVFKNKNLDVFVERNNKLEKYYPPEFRK